MTLEIKHIREAGQIDKERIVLVAKDVVDIGDYAIFQTTSDGNAVFADVKNTFWIPDGTINSGDLIVIYTKQGSTSVKKNKNGTTSTFLYWGLDEPLWIKGEKAAVILKIASWSATQP